MGRQLQALAPIFALAIFLTSPASAQNDAPISDQDCRVILDNYAVSPKAVVSDVVNQCQQILAAAPCPADSVHCWGDWAALAPAAAGGGAGSDSIIEFDFTADELGLGPELDDPVGFGCLPGASCGFSAFVDGTDPPTSADATIVRFTLADDGTSFVNDPGGANEIRSPELTAIFFDNSGIPVIAGYSVSPTFVLNEVANVSCPTCTNGDAVTSIVYAGVAGAVWRNIDADGNAANGVFGWGRAATQADLDNLNSGNRSLNFSGVMSLNSDINADITVNFGGTPDWSGSWDDGGLIDFDAGGVVSGGNFKSLPNQFSDNVTNRNSGAVVEGSVVGVPGNHAAVHVIDVDLTGVGSVRDAGILGQVIIP